MARSQLIWQSRERYNGGGTLESVARMFDNPPRHAEREQRFWYGAPPEDPEKRCEIELVDVTP